jgi:hypothetical protein
VRFCFSKVSRSPTGREVDENSVEFYGVPEKSKAERNLTFSRYLIVLFEARSGLLFFVQSPNFQ